VGVVRTLSVVVEPMEPADWPAVRAIFQAGIETGDATLEAEAPEWQTWDAAHRSEGRLIALDAVGRERTVLGWAALTPVSGRCVYEGVAEVSVYVAPEARGRGVGTALLEALATASEEAGIWTLQAHILRENAASVALHERVGFRVVGVRERLGRDPGGRWRDILLMERRTPAIE
jgi:phosphinothricin acetyltransferase